METLLVERKDGVATVTMNRPERKNPANGRMLLELRAIFEEIEAHFTAPVRVKIDHELHQEQFDFAIL